MRVLFVTNDYIGEKRAGPAIRAMELARVLSKSCDVTVASARPGQIASDGIQFIFNSVADLKPLRAAARSSDIVVTQGNVLQSFPFLKRAQHLVIELYDPYLFEYLAHPHGRFTGWGYWRQWYLVNEQLSCGDFFICANERQRDYWLGRFCALGRLTPEQYGQDPSFRNLLAVIPFGIPPDPPRHLAPAVKGVVPGIAHTDVLLLWGGGIWQWFDPLTLIRAMHEVGKERSDIKLLFLGVGHPDPNEPKMSVVRQSLQLSRELGVLGKSVFFHEGWVPQEELQNYLLEADVGVATYPDTAETRFAFRTRVRDYIWAGLPLILTRGDSFAELVEHHNLGRTVNARDVDGLKNAILELASSAARRAEIRKSLSQIAPRFYWDTVAAPLLQYCAEPYRTPRSPVWRKQLVPFLSRAYQRGYDLLARHRHSANHRE
jgi:glycosyltransferase involved in cell wall biosynthesis